MAGIRPSQRNQLRFTAPPAGRAWSWGIRRSDRPRARGHRRQDRRGVPTLAFVGLATFHRVLQSGIEDLGYARRIAQLRDYYFDHAPELAGYLPNPAERLPIPGLGIRLWQQFVTVAGMVAVITAVLSGSAGGLLAAVVLVTRRLPRRSP
jgi:hypothetical protein